MYPESHDAIMSKHMALRSDAGAAALGRAGSPRLRPSVQEQMPRRRMKQATLRSRSAMDERCHGVVSKACAAQLGSLKQIFYLVLKHLS